MKRCLIALGLLALLTPCFAHWSSPGYLELEQQEQNTYAVLWKVPTQTGRPLELTPVLPPHCTETTPVNAYRVGTAIIHRWIMHCAGGLIEQTISIDGLPNSLTDVLVRINRLDGTTQTVRLTANDASFVVLQSPGWSDIALTYLVLGVEHILSGIDHLLFVLALLIIVSGWRRLVATITAFTLAHSLTLGAATLGFVYVPRPPVEAAIALSILFLAVEIVHAQLWSNPRYTPTRQQAQIRADSLTAGNPPHSAIGMQGYQSLTFEWPWLVAFTFGLLHGFGFAGALTEVGLPQNAIPLALLFFNLGVEVGQLLFVVAFLIFSWMLGDAVHKHSRWVQITAAYAIGAVAAYWTIERIASFWI